MVTLVVDLAQTKVKQTGEYVASLYAAGGASEIGAGGEWIEDSIVPLVDTYRSLAESLRKKYC